MDFVEMRLTCQVAVGGIAGEGNQAAGSAMNGCNKGRRRRKRQKNAGCRLQAGGFMGELTREAAELKKDYLWQADIKKLEAW